MRAKCPRNTYSYSCATYGAATYGTEPVRGSLFASLNILLSVLGQMSQHITIEENSIE